MSVSSEYKSTYALYSCGLSPAKNAMIDSMNLYLSGHATRIVYGDCGFLKPALETYIDIVMDGYIAQTTLAGNYFVYTCKTFDDATTKTWYYFVSKMERRANAVVRLTLQLDTINSFQDVVTGGLSAKTMIKRQHCDRFVKYANYSPVAGDVTLLKKVDNRKEASESVLKLRSESIAVKENDQTNVDWYILYKNRVVTADESTASPVDGYLVPSASLRVNNAQTEPNPIITWTNEFEAGKWYYFCTADNESGCSFKMGNTSYSMTTNYALKVYAAAGYGKRMTLYTLSDQRVYAEISDGDYEAITFTAMRRMRVTASQSANFTAIWAGSIVQVDSGVIPTFDLLPFSSIDRTDSTIVKIIKLPYLPLAVTEPQSHEFSFDGASYDSGMLKLDSLDPFESVLLDDDNVKAWLKSNLAETIAYTGSAPMSLKSRFINDPKILMSDLTSVSFAFDSYSFSWPLEDLAPASRYDYGSVDERVYDLNLYFKMTSTINSVFGFKFEWAETSGLSPFTSFKFPTSYDWMIVTRNNEVTVYSSSYINYIKTGYNYDKKIKATQTASRWTSAAISLANTAATAILAPTGIGAVATAAMAASSLSTISNAISSQVKEDHSFQEKIEELKAQAVGVSGSDDVDLLTAYSENKLRFMVFEPRDETKRLYDDLFYYFGYYRGFQDVPDWTSRYWFNFVQCDAVFTDETRLPSDFLDDIKNRLSVGVTDYHEHNSTTRPVHYYYDLDQNNENWETWVLG